MHYPLCFLFEVWKYTLTCLILDVINYLINFGCNGILRCKEIEILQCDICRNIVLLVACSIDGAPWPSSPICKISCMQNLPILHCPHICYILLFNASPNCGATKLVKECALKHSFINGSLSVLQCGTNPIKSASFHHL